jgi:hypothetical protein
VELAEAQTMLAARDEELGDATAELEATRAKLADATEAMVDAHDQLSELQERLAGAEEQQAQAEYELSDKPASLAEVQEQAAELKRQLAELRQQHEAAAAEAAAASGRADGATVQLEQAQAVHSFLLQQQRLRRITSAALVLESTPEALRLDVQGTLRPLLACLQELGLSQASRAPACADRRRQQAQLPGPVDSATLARLALLTKSPAVPTLPLPPTPLSRCRSRRPQCSAPCGGSDSRRALSWSWGLPSCNAATFGLVGIWGWREHGQRLIWLPSPACC